MHRSTFNIYEEFRLIDKEVKDSVLSEFLHPRQTPFLNKYPELREEGREVYISSAGFKSEWIWEQVKASIESYYNGDTRSRFAFFDYLLSLKHGLKTKKAVAKQRREKNSLAFSTEVENLFFSESENAFYTYILLSKNRKLKKAWYPSSVVDNRYNIKRTQGEIRLLSMDVASSGRSDSDNSIITLMRLIPTKLGYIREIPYIASFNGVNSIVQSKILKSLYYQFGGDYVVLDVLGVGTAGVYDVSTTITKDDESEMGEYPAWQVMQHHTINKGLYEDLAKRTLGKNGLPCVYPINSSSNFNHDIAIQLKDDLEKGLIRFLVDEIEAEDAIEKIIKDKGKKAEYILSDISKKVEMIAPYAQTSELINEMVALETTILNGKIRLKEASHKRKDRYMSLAYCNYFAGLLDQKLLKESDDFNWSDYVCVGKDSFQ